MIAEGIIRISGNNDFVNQICIHGQDGVTMSSGNYFEDGVGVGMGNYVDLKIPSSDITKGEGLYEAMYDDYDYPYHEGDLHPKMVYQVTNVINGLKSLDPDYLPNYITVKPMGDGNGDGIDDAVITVDNNFDFTTAVEGNVYHVACPSNTLVSLPGDVTIQNIAIVSECRLSGGSNTLFTNVTLTSDARGNGSDPYSQHSIRLSASVVLGIDDDCAPGGGVQIWSEASVHTSAFTSINGSQIVARGDVELGARSAGINGVAIQAGGDITMTSNNVMGLCSGGNDLLLTADYYRLVR
jgi:hypothetical protein